MTCRRKFCATFVAIVILIIVNKTVLFTWEAHIKREQQQKQLTKDRNIANVKRISKKFELFNKKYEREKLSYSSEDWTAPADLRKSTLKDILNRSKSDIKMRTQNELNGPESYKLYIADTLPNEIQNQLINLHKFNYSMNNMYACSGHVLVVILVSSEPRHVEERSQIRRTWGSVRYFSGATIVTMFLIGHTSGDNRLQANLERESQENLDLVQGEFVDSIKNSTYKAVMGLDWVGRYCGSAKFVLKVDDATMIDPYHLVNYLLQKSPDGDIENFLYCSVSRNQSPVRNVSDKLFVSEKEYMYAKYPTYCEGFAYIMSRDVSRKLYDATRALRPFSLDDVYLTGFGAFIADVDHTEMESGHAHKPMLKKYLSKNIRSVLFLQAHTDAFRNNWDNAWNDIQAVNKI